MIGVPFIHQVYQWTGISHIKHISNYGLFIDQCVYYFHLFWVPLNAHDTGKYDSNMDVKRLQDTSSYCSNDSKGDFLLFCTPQTSLTANCLLSQYFAEVRIYSKIFEWMNSVDDQINVQWNLALWTPHPCGHPALVDTFLRARWEMVPLCAICGPWPHLDSLVWTPHYCGHFLPGP